jgi:hypothetical protein
VQLLNCKTALAAKLRKRQRCLPPHVLPAGARRVWQPRVAVEACVVPSVGALDEERSGVALELRARVVEGLAEQAAVVGPALAFEAAQNRVSNGFRFYVWNNREAIQDCGWVFWRILQKSVVGFTLPFNAVTRRNGSCC